MNRHIAEESLLIVVVIVTTTLSVQTAAIAATAKFTASAPAGGTNFPSLVNYSLTKTGGDNFSNAIDFPADVSGHNVVSEMNFQMENFSNSSFNGSVSGNMMTVQDISSAAASGGGGGLDVWVDLDTMLDPCPQLRSGPRLYNPIPAEFSVPHVDAAGGRPGWADRAPFRPTVPSVWRSHSPTTPFRQPDRSRSKIRGRLIPV